MACGVNVKELGSLSVCEFAEFLGTKFDEDVVEAFRRNKISGSIFQLMSEEQITSLVTAIGDIIELQQLQKESRPTPYNTPVTSIVKVCLLYNNKIYI